MSRLIFVTVFFLSIFLQNCSVIYKTNHVDLPLKETEVETIKYSDSNCYARGIFIQGDEIFTANSNGKVYSYNTKNKTKIEFFEPKNIEELRDLNINNGIIYSMQSGSTGKMLVIEPSINSVGLKEYDFWKGIFLDGMDFYGNTGFLMGDPVNDFFSLYVTKDGGRKWTPCEGKITAQKGEAGYAASGTNLQVLNDSTFIFVSGGTVNHFFKSTDSGKTWTNTVIPFNTGEGIGPFSVCFKNENEGVAVGGDWQKPNETTKTVFYTLDGGKTWSASATRGFRSCVYYKNDVFYSCGSNGVDFSINGGITWRPLLDGTFFAMTSDDKYLYITSSNATIKKIKLLN